MGKKKRQKEKSIQRETRVMTFHHTGDMTEHKNPCDLSTELNNNNKKNYL